MQNENDTSTRRMVMILMKTKGALSVNELSKEIGITEMAIRRHLNTLERDGLINTKLTRQAMGRPMQLYSLTLAADDLFPQNYHHLTLDLLAELEAESVGQLFVGRKQKLLIKYADRMEGKKLGERVAELVDIQNANGYMVNCEIDDSGDYLFTEYNCPIAQVAKQYNEACHCELALFKNLLETDVECTECLTKGGSKCTYLIKA